MDLGIPALLPEDYVPDVHQRLILYKRIASAADAEALRELKVELIDRFGLLPQQTTNLFTATELKLRCVELGIERLEIGESGGRLRFSAEPRIDPMALIQLVQKQPERYRFDGSQVLRILQQFESTQASVEFVDGLLDELLAVS